MENAKSSNTNETPKTGNDSSKTNDEIIQLWYTLQKVIKEKITLQEISKKY